MRCRSSSLDRVEDAGAAALLDDPQRRLRGVLDGRLEAAALGHVAEPLAVQRVIPVAARELDVLRIAAAALLRDDPPFPSRSSLRIGAGVCSRFSTACASAFERPRRHQRRLDAGRRRGVRILIDGRVDAARARLVDQLERVDAPAPVRLADDLVVRDLRRQPALLADLDRLAHAVEHARRFVAHVRDVDAAHARRRPSRARRPRRSA